MQHDLAAPPMALRLQANRRHEKKTKKNGESFLCSIDGMKHHSNQSRTEHINCMQTSHCRSSSWCFHFVCARAFAAIRDCQKETAGFETHCSPTLPTAHRPPRPPLLHPPHLCPIVPPASPARGSRPAPGASPRPCAAHWLCDRRRFLLSLCSPCPAPAARRRSGSREGESRWM